MKKHSYSHLLEYIPVRFTGLSVKQLNDRRDVFNFKDGNTPASIKLGLLSKVKEIIGDSKADWTVCFIPASTKAKTYNRYSTLALFLAREAGCEVFIDTIENTADSSAGHISGKSSDPTANFRINGSRISGKNVILIDDVITRGRTFEDTAAKLEGNGAKSVTGLFVAKTIHPNLPQSTSINLVREHDIFYGETYDDYMEALAMEMEYESILEDVAAEEAMAEMEYGDVLADIAAEEAYYDEY